MWAQTLLILDTAVPGSNRECFKQFQNSKELMGFLKTFWDMEKSDQDSVVPWPKMTQSYVSPMFVFFWNGNWLNEKNSPIWNLRCSCLWEQLAVLETSSTCFWIKWWGSNAWQACWVSALVVLDGELPMLQTWDMESGSTWASPLHGQSTGFCAWHMIL